MRRKTTEEFIAEVYELERNNYTVLGKYINARTKILMRHNCIACDNYEYEVAPDNFINSNTRCPKCAGILLKTDDEFKENVFRLVGSKYSVLGEYINASTKILMRHNECGYEWGITPNCFLRGNRCPKCFGTHRKTTEEFKQEIYSLVKDEYSVLGEYVNNSTKILLKHNICKYEYEVLPSNFLKGRRCPKCAGKVRKTTGQFKQEVYELVGEEYTILEEYQGVDVKIKIRHNSKSCNYNEYPVSPYNFLKGNRCPICSRKRH